MFKALKNCFGQIVMGEYVLTFFLLVAVIGAMTLYFQRTLQGRVHDARDYMINYVRTQTSQLDANGNAYYSGPLDIAYEPYYANSVSDVLQKSAKRESLEAGATSGIYRAVGVLDAFQTMEKTSAVTTSNTAPPKDAD